MALQISMCYEHEQIKLYQENLSFCIQNLAV